VPDDHLAKAGETIEFPRYALTGGYSDEAGRGAYMAAYHAAMAFISARTGTSPKTHSGARSEFGRLARNEARITREQVSLLGWTYELKNASDYGQQRAVATEDAERAIDDAAKLIETIASFVAPSNPSQ
jgi:uncharacterized protein (UPF0332 family)